MPRANLGHYRKNLNRINQQLKFMKKLNALFLLCLLFPLTMVASVWDTEYKQVEQSIREPKFP